MSGSVDGSPDTSAGVHSHAYTPPPPPRGQTNSFGRRGSARGGELRGNNLILPHISPHAVRNRSPVHNNLIQPAPGSGSSGGGEGERHVPPPTSTDLHRRPSLPANTTPSPSDDNTASLHRSRSFVGRGASIPHPPTVPPPSSSMPRSPTSEKMERFFGRPGEKREEEEDDGEKEEDGPKAPEGGKKSSGKYVVSAERKRKQRTTAHSPKNRPKPKPPLRKPNLWR